MKKILVTFLPIIMAFVVPSTAIAKSNDTFISETTYDDCFKYGEEYGICPELLMTIIERESAGQADAENGEISSYAQWILDRSAELERIHEKENVKMGELEKERIKAIISGMNDEELKAVASEIPSRIILSELSLRMEILEMKVDATKKAIMSEKKKEIMLI